MTWTSLSSTVEDLGQQRGVGLGLLLDGLGLLLSLLEVLLRQDLFLLAYLDLLLRATLFEVPRPLLHLLPLLLLFPADLVQGLALLNAGQVEVGLLLGLSDFRPHALVIDSLFISQSLTQVTPVKPVQVLAE